MGLLRLVRCLEGGSSRQVRHCQGKEFLRAGLHAPSKRHMSLLLLSVPFVLLLLGLFGPVGCSPSRLKTATKQSSCVDLG